MNDNFEGWRVTALCRPKYSFGHNIRQAGYVENKKHIERSFNMFSKIIFEIILLCKQL